MLVSTPRPFDGNTILNGEKSICMTIELLNTAVFERRKSYVRSYCLSVDTYASDSDIARGSTTPDVDGGEYIDFPSATDSLDNGNNPNLRSALTEYLMRAGTKTARASAEQQRTALLSRRRP
jgi:4-aminobutyrate aminotransferase-like enzyme